jgi:hypothetical protein
MSEYEDDHRVALARELTYEAGFPLRDRYGFAASHETVLYVVQQVFAHPADDAAVEAIGVANALGDIQIARGYDMPTDEEYELGIVRALRPLAEQRRDAAVKGLR